MRKFLGLPMITATFVDVWDQVDQPVNSQIEDRTGKIVLNWIKSRVENPIRNQVADNFLRGLE